MHNLILLLLVVVAQSGWRLCSEYTERERERERETDSRESYRLISIMVEALCYKARERERGERVSVFKLIISY